MSWSVSIVGEPEALVAELDRQGEKMQGQSKAEFDAAKPGIVALVRQNLRLDGAPDWCSPPLLMLDASGSGCESGGKQVANSCTVNLRPVAGRFVK